MAKRKYKKKKKLKQLRIGGWTILSIIGAVMLLISLPLLKKGRHAEYGAKIPHRAFCYGIDISHYQKEIQWDSLRILTDGAGRTIRSKSHAKDIRPVSFVFIKATEGTSMKDRHFKMHWKSAKENGIKRGAYHFFRSSKDPELQARSFIRTVGKLDRSDLPPVLDIETIHGGCSKEALNYKALKWLKTVESHYGRKPIVYSSSYFIRDILCDEIKSDYPIWVAHYETNSPLIKNWKFWQFSDKAIVYGIDGYIDLNVCSRSVLDEI
jgi:lysozyme